jgi:hypothetical protein
MAFQFQDRAPDDKGKQARERNERERQEALKQQALKQLCSIAFHGSVPRLEPSEAGAFGRYDFVEPHTLTVHALRRARCTAKPKGLTKS